MSNPDDTDTILKELARDTHPMFQALYREAMRPLVESGWRP